ncbi:XerC Integrase [uncultured Caudovirales phage]|uniref:Integrase n=1 Tax=uncultured Caudovirales phage TaxID=2100421 RepID=A0A6J5KV48_9CAUD|nr:XerC Integrase [uncultured Caudovirales phage]
MVRSRGKAWQADVKVNGRQTRPQFATQAEAEEFEKDPYKALGIKDQSLICKVQFKLWAKKCYNGTRTGDKDGRRIADELIDWFADMRVEDVRYKHVEAFKEGLFKKGNASQTVNNKISVLSKLLRQGVKEEVLGAMPIIEFIPQKKGRIRFLTPQEEAGILQALPEKSQAFAMFLSGTGCRPSEAMMLEWEDVDFERESVSFWRNKTDDPRTIPLTPNALESLRRTYEWGWTRPFGETVYITFATHFEAAKKAIGLQHDKSLVPYTMRHTVATRLSKGGIESLQLKKWMGHRSLKTTENYVHLDSDDLLTARDKLTQGSRIKTMSPQVMVRPSAEGVAKAKSTLRPRKP